MSRTDHRRQFVEQGYTVFKSALGGDLLDILRDECRYFMAREDARLDALGRDSDGITHRGRRYFAGECQRARPRLRNVLLSEAMAAVCRETLGDTVYFFYDQYVVKGPEQGMAFSWHQDSGYMVGNGGPADHRPYLTCWCPLDDATVDNGTLRLLPFTAVPESGRRILPHRRDVESHDLIGWEADASSVILEVPAGSVVAFSSLLLHASGANHSPELRRVYLAQYTAEVILDPGTRQLRRDAIPFLKDGKVVTLP
jgi:ectoine hydroxylase-related dioxygenase (phytanoyl-CoA dioxygenase family)